jgi:kinesin family protein 22
LKAVEVEVARRMEEREKLRIKEEESLANAQMKKETLPSGILTPLLKKHRDLDDELKHRLHELEAKL